MPWRDCWSWSSCGHCWQGHRLTCIDRNTSDPKQGAFLLKFGTNIMTGCIYCSQTLQNRIGSMCSYILFCLYYYYGTTLATFNHSMKKALKLFQPTAIFNKVPCQLQGNPLRLICFVQLCTEILENICLKAIRIRQ